MSTSSPQLSRRSRVAITLSTDLFTALTRLSSSQLMALYGELFTKREAIMFAKRLGIARCLLRGYSYQRIERALGVTPTTISQIRKKLNADGRGLREADALLSPKQSGFSAAAKNKSDSGVGGTMRSWLGRPKT